jgi:hypothetical protein
MSKVAQVQAPFRLRARRVPKEIGRRALAESERAGLRDAAIRLRGKSRHDRRATRGMRRDAAQIYHQRMLA